MNENFKLELRSKEKSLICKIFVVTQSESDKRSTKTFFNFSATNVWRLVTSKWGKRKDRLVISSMNYKFVILYLLNVFYSIKFIIHCNMNMYWLFWYYNVSKIKILLSIIKVCFCYESINYNIYIMCIVILL